MTNTSFSNANKINTQRITALWAFSEATFGGILHALKIPFTGLFLGSAAVLFITLISWADKNKTSILHATLLVILVKATINPYSPLTVYFAISVQGIAGYIFYRFIPYERLAALMLGFFSLLFSALQKVIFLTVLFGANLWKSLNSFADSIFSQLGITIPSNSIDFSLLIVCTYTGLHICMGIFIGIKSIKIRNWILKNNLPNADEIINDNNNEEYFPKKKHRGKKFWWMRMSGIFVLSFLLSIMIYSYLYPNLSKIPAYEILFMLVRSIVITLVWFFLISPVVLKSVRKLLMKKQNKNLEEINHITSLFPFFRRIISYCWKNSSQMHGIKRFKKIITESFLYIITIKIEQDK